MSDTKTLENYVDCEVILHFLDFTAEGDTKRIYYGTLTAHDPLFVTLTPYVDAAQVRMSDALATIHKKFQEDEPPDVLTLAKSRVMRISYLDPSS